MVLDENWQGIKVHKGRKEQEHGYGKQQQYHELAQGCRTEASRRYRGACDRIPAGSLDRQYSQAQQEIPRD